MAPDADEQRVAALAVMEVPLGGPGRRVWLGGKGRGALPMSTALSRGSREQMEQITAWNQPQDLE